MGGVKTADELVLYTIIKVASLHTVSLYRGVMTFKALYCETSQ